eukprot:g2860.t1
MGIRADGIRAGGALPPEDAWIASFDHDAFRDEIRALGKKLIDNQGPDDLAHLQRIVLASNCLCFAGLSTMWVGTFWWSVFSVICLSTWTFSRWTMIGHHVCHGGYDSVDVTKRYNRFSFAVNGLARRVGDWFDWMLPEAWNVEHNNMHHYSLGEANDPDLVEENLQWLRRSSIPLAAKYALVSAMSLVWKWSYYAPNTYKELKLAQLRRSARALPPRLAHLDPCKSVTLASVLSAPRGTFWFSASEFFARVAGPYLLFHFLVLPAPLLLVPARGTAYFASAVRNLVLAELLTNAHAFSVIVNNHAGSDLYRFGAGVKPKSGSFYLRQVISSANFHTGCPFTGSNTGALADANDFFHGWLNYQIEHHLWPSASMLTYQRAQPLVQAVCARHGVPYVQHSFAWRVHKTAQIMTGQNSMRRFPAAYERAADLAETARSEIQAEGGVAFKDE